MFALKACAAKREEGVLGRAEFFTVAIVGGKCGGCGVFNIEPAFCHFLAARKNSVFRSGDYFDVMAADHVEYFTGASRFADRNAFCQCWFRFDFD